MPEKPKNENENENERVQTEREKKETAEGAWSKDQRENGYYYDDNHGYEIYNPDADDDDDED